MQIQKPKGVGHRRPAAADFERNIFLPHSKFVSQSGVPLGFFDWVEIGSLQIFDQRKFEDFQVVSCADNGWHRCKTEFLRGAPPALAGDQFKSRADPSEGSKTDKGLMPGKVLCLFGSQ